MIDIVEEADLLVLELISMAKKKTVRLFMKYSFTEETDDLQKTRVGETYRTEPVINQRIVNTENTVSSDELKVVLNSFKVGGYVVVVETETMLVNGGVNLSKFNS